MVSGPRPLELTTSDLCRDSSKDHGLTKQHEFHRHQSSHVTQTLWPAPCMITTALKAVEDNSNWWWLSNSFQKEYVCYILSHWIVVIRCNHCSHIMCSTPISVLKGASRHAGPAAKCAAISSLVICVSWPRSPTIKQHVWNKQNQILYQKYKTTVAPSTNLFRQWPGVPLSTLCRRAAGSEGSWDSVSGTRLQTERFEHPWRKNIRKKRGIESRI